MSEVNLEQDPADFAAQAMNTDPADSPPEQPKDPEPAGSTPAEPKPPETPAAPEKPADPATPAPAEPVDPAKPVVDPEPKPPVEPAPADPQGQPKVQTPEEKQAQEAAQKITDLGQANAAKYDSMVAVVRDNPDSLKALHSTDPQMADKIAQELWQADGFDDLMKQAEIEEQKADDPDGAETASRIYALEKDAEKNTKQLRETHETAFFESKGIMNNPFDPKHKSLMDSMKNINPELIKTDYPKALNMAYADSFPARTDAEILADQKAILLAKGTGALSGGGIKPETHREPENKHPQETQDFMNMVGAK